MSEARASCFVYNKVKESGGAASPYYTELSHCRFFIEFEFRVHRGLILDRDYQTFGNAASRSSCAIIDSLPP
jgi:hypothetical protein